MTKRLLPGFGVGVARVAVWPTISLLVACVAEAGIQPAFLELFLAPGSTTVVTGGQQQFTATATLSDGSTQNNPTVTWTATGGSITSAGLYTAGVTAGTFRVIARQTGGTPADTAAVFVTTSGGFNRYATTFPLTENPISEGGRWINGGSVGLDWTNVATTPGRAFGLQVGPSYSDATALLTGAWGPDQKVEATVFAQDQKDECYQEVELRLRSAISPHLNRGYEISFKASQSGDAYLIIVVWHGPFGSFNYLFDGRDAKYGVKTGDVVSARVVGNVITAYKNGVLLGQATDNTYTTGSPGIGFNLENAPAGCSGTNSHYGFTRFTATDSVGTAVRLRP